MTDDNSTTSPRNWADEDLQQFIDDTDEDVIVRGDVATELREYDVMATSADIERLLELLDEQS